MPKRTPDEEFKRFNSEACFQSTEKNNFLDDDYYKKIKIPPDNKDDHKSSIGSKGSRGSSENQTPRFVNPLKETSSTTSA